MDRSASSPSAKEGELLMNWATIEAHIRKQDTVMFDGYNDDINTLLVFAGLFSAVLTAFLVESYQWLQDDPAQASAQVLMLILDHITGQSMSSSSGLPSQKTTATSVWINVLWFLSLVLSLGSALFAMVAKQWLREYISWTSSSSPARGLSQLRQIRWTALHDWHVFGIISLIPGLLEIALVLLLFGLGILLWTLNVIVASVLTVAMSLLVILGFIVTILPTFAPRCPYRSPLAWGFLLFWSHLCQTPRLINPLIRLFGGHPLPVFDIPVSGGWGARDFLNDCATENLPSWGWLSLFIFTPNHDYKKYRTDVIETETLLRCLVWIASNSRDQSLLKEVLNCTAMVHPLYPESQRQQLATGIHAVCNVCNINSVLLAAYSTDLYHRAAVYGVPVYICKTSPHAAQLDGIMKVQQITHDLPDATLEVVSHFLFHDVISFLHEMLALDASSSNGSQRLSLSTGSFTSQFQAFVDIISFFVCSVSSRRSLSLLPSDGNKYPSLGCTELCDTLCRFSSHVAFNVNFSRRFPGFKATLLDVLGELATLHIEKETILKATPLSLQQKAATYIRLATRSYHHLQQIGDSSDGPLLEDECHAFVILCSRAVAISISTLTLHPDFPMMFAFMAVYSDLALHKCWNNAGCLTPFPWIEDLWRLVETKSLSLKEITRYLEMIPRSLLDNLQRMCEQGLITRTDSAFKLSKLIEMHVQQVFHNPTVPPLFLDLHHPDAFTRYDEAGSPIREWHATSRRSTLPSIFEIRNLQRLSSVCLQAERQQQNEHGPARDTDTMRSTDIPQPTMLSESPPPLSVRSFELLAPPGPYNSAGMSAAMDDMRASQEQTVRKQSSGQLRYRVRWADYAGMEVPASLHQPRSNGAASRESPDRRGSYAESIVATWVPVMGTNAAWDSRQSFEMESYHHRTGRIVTFPPTFIPTSTPPLDTVPLHSGECPRRDPIIQSQAIEMPGPLSTAPSIESYYMPEVRWAPVPTSNRIPPIPGYPFLHTADLPHSFAAVSTATSESYQHTDVSIQVQQTVESAGFASTETNNPRSSLPSSDNPRRLRGSFQRMTNLVAQKSNEPSDSPGPADHFTMLTPSEPPTSLPHSFVALPPERFEQAERMTHTYTDLRSTPLPDLPQEIRVFLQPPGSGEARPLNDAVPRRFDHEFRDSEYHD